MSPIKQKTFILHDGNYMKYNEKKEAEFVGAVPAMRGTTTNGVTVTASTSYNGDYPGWRAFDGTNANSNKWLSGGGFPQHLMVDFGTKKKIVGYSLSAPDVSQVVNNWIFQGSNDNAVWIDLDAVVNYPLPVLKSTYFSIDNDESYPYYRIYVQGASVGSFATFSEAQLYEEVIPATPAKWEVVSTILPTSAQFLSDGMEVLSPLLDRKGDGKSPLDELTGDFEVVTWIDESGNGQESLNVTGTISPKLIYNMETTEFKDSIDSLFASVDSEGYSEDHIRFILTSNNVNWATWENGEFTSIALDSPVIIEKGMTAEELSSLTTENMKKWTADSINIGVLLVDDISGEYSSKLISTGIQESKYIATTTISDANLYILNTTATISVDFSGLTLIGQVSDEDMTKVQYRVRLNGQPYYPKDGEFTALAPPPLNIDITLRSDEIKIGEWNELEVDFQDSFGEMDTWKSGQFEGKYAGLMFQDSEGNDYSTDLGTVIKYLDFGQIISGQITPSYEVKVKNSYGFDVKNASISVSTNNFANGLTVQLAKEVQAFSDDAEMLSLGDLKNAEEATFFIRMVSNIDTIPNGASEFNIIVVADRDLENL